jgi:hypothetical protein
MAIRGLVSYWWLPVISGLVWCGMLLGMLLSWIIDTNSKHYSSMSENQTIAYISDIGASHLKPLFIAGCVVTTVFLDLSFVAERWLRHQGRLVPNTTLSQKILAVLTVVFALVGTAGLILLSVFDTVHHDRLHDMFLILFIGGYLLSAIFTCWEYQRLGAIHRQHSILRISFWVKLAFIIIEFCLAVAFVACSVTKNYNIAAIFEWIVSFVFTLYIISFFIDLYPAIRTKAPHARFSKPVPGDMEQASTEYQGYGNGSNHYRQPQPAPHHGSNF